nr:hypothetical protein [Tanacetum cinerariifolium]
MLESRRFVLLQKELSKVINSKSGSKVKAKTALIVHQSENKNSNVYFLREKYSKDEPPVKKLKVLIPTPEIPTPTPLSSFNTTSSGFSQSPPREPTLLRVPSKDKGVSTEEPMKELIPYLEEGGSNPTMLNPKSFVLQEGHLTIEDILAQAKEMKRLPDLKVEKEKSEESLKKCSTQLLLKLILKSRLNMRRKRPKCLRNTTSVSMRGLINCLSPRFTTESTRLRMLQ